MQTRNAPFSDAELWAIRHYFQEQGRFTERVISDYVLVHRLLHRVRFLVRSGLSPRFKPNRGANAQVLPRLQNQIENRLVALFGE